MKRTIAYITDPHMDDAFTKGNQVDARKSLESILQEVHAAGISEVIIGGDIGEKSSHEFFFGLLQQYAKDFKITLGNHDEFNDIIPVYNPLPAERNEFYYAYEREGYKYIFLDSSAEEISPAQFDWFKSEMHTALKVLLFLHHPVLMVDAEVDRMFPLKGRERLTAVLQHHAKEVHVFCGHYHLEDEQVQGHIHQYVTLAVSIQFVKEAATLEMDKTTFGYRVITISDTGVATELVLKKREPGTSF
jgi:Icc protein